MLGYMVIKATGIGQPWRALVKVVLSTTFLGVGISYGLVADWPHVTMLVPIALLFAWIGDALLLAKHKLAYFHTGCLFFGISNVLLTAYAIHVYKWQWWSLIAFAVFMVAMFLCQRYNVFSFGKSKRYLNFYSLAVGYNGFLGLSIALTVASTPAILFGLGCFMFLVSDFALAMFMFKCKKWPIDVLNSLLYFSGLMLIALSLAYN